MLGGRKSPPKPQPPPRTGLLTTLRAPTSKSDDEDARRLKERYKTKPLGTGKHKHHEGARRRWREEITPRERRRYEAVWASNRGQLDADQEGSGPGPGSRPGPAADNITNSDVDSCVANVVVRDLWSRSRLPRDERAEVWDLVDGSGRGMLTKAEFVVGMWLVDQRLRGRKIPAKVGESVWGSARGYTVSAPQREKVMEKGRG